MSLALLKSEGFHCPYCGQPVRTMKRSDYALLEAGREPQLREKAPQLKIAAASLVAPKASAAPWDKSPEEKRPQVRSKELSHCPHCRKELRKLIGSGGTLRVAQCYECGHHVDDPISQSEQSDDTAIVMTSSPSLSIVSELKELATLHTAGALTDDEFTMAKAALLARKGQ